MKLFTTNGTTTQAVNQYENPISGLFLVGVMHDSDAITVSLNGPGGYQQNIINDTKISALKRLKNMGVMFLSGRLYIPFTTGGSLPTGEGYFLSVTYRGGDASSSCDVYAAQQPGIAGDFLVYESVYFTEVEKTLSFQGALMMDLTGVANATLTDLNGKTFKLQSEQECIPFFTGSNTVDVQGIQTAKTLGNAIAITGATMDETIGFVAVSGLSHGQIKLTAAGTRVIIRIQNL